MAEAQSNGNGAGKRLWRRPKVWFLFGIPAGGFLMFFVGVAALGAFNSYTDYTNTLGFCTSCHEMRDFLFEEYKQTIHYKNESGVRAVCADCHVPKPFGPMLLDKIRATFNEVPAKVLGTIDTRAKFEAKRLELAEDVWGRMKATDSRECRNCHVLEAMDLASQGRSARKKHTLEHELKTGDTCIDCHKGIAHHLPELSED